MTKSSMCLHNESRATWFQRLHTSAFRVLSAYGISLNTISNSSGASNTRSDAVLCGFILEEASSVTEKAVAAK
jgi:hypothetical protein